MENFNGSNPTTWTLSFVNGEDEINFKRHQIENITTIWSVRIAFLCLLVSGFGVFFAIIVIQLDDGDIDHHDALHLSLLLSAVILEPLFFKFSKLACLRGTLITLLSHSLLLLPATTTAFTLDFFYEMGL